MKRVTIAVAHPADRVLADGLGELGEVLDQLGDSAFVVGGLMTTIWHHLGRIRDLPARATADLDVGIDRKSLFLARGRRVVGPLLEQCGFKGGMGDKTFRYTKVLASGESFLVDLLVAPGASRNDPPLLERGTETIAAPGLAYAFLRRPVLVRAEFIDGSKATAQVLRVPTLDAAFVLKGTLVRVRSAPGKLETDTVDAVMLAALCLEDAQSIRALVEHGKRSDVRKALAFLDSINGPRARSARRVEGYFASEHGAVGAGTWAAEVAQQLADAVRKN